MKRVVQNRTGEDGNCFAACLASILEIPLKKVPDFTDDGFIEQANSFLAEHGLSYKRVPLSAKPSGYSTIEGISPRGGLHACVAKDGELIWDPHPIEDGTGQGLVEPRYYGLLEKVGRAKDAHGTRPGDVKHGKGAFTIQVTEKGGREHVEPVGVLRAYDSTLGIIAILAGIYAWYLAHKAEQPNYSLETHSPKRRAY